MTNMATFIRKEKMMKGFKKRYVVLTLIALPILAALLFFLLTKGYTYEEDGALRNSRIHMRNVRLEGDHVYYIIENDTCLSIGIGQVPQIQKKVNGVWQDAPIWDIANKSVSKVSPFSEKEQHFSLGTFIEDFAGEYRLIQEGAVGYLTITEEMAAMLPDYQIHYTDGIRQSGLVYIDNMRFDGGKIRFVLHNEVPKPHLPFSFKGAVQKKVDGEWQYYKLAQGKDQSEVILKADTETDYYFWINTSLSDIAGEYRLIIGVDGCGPFVQTNAETGEKYLEFIEGETYIVGNFTIDGEAPAP